MKTKINMIIAVLMSIGVYPIKVDTVWSSGDHVILDGDNYFEIWMYDDSIATMFGGDVYKLEAFDTSSFNVLDGEIDRLYVHDDSTINIFGGTLYTLKATQNSSAYIYAYDVTYDPLGGGYGKGWLTGRYISNNDTFGFSLFSQDNYSHVSIIPEPSTISLVGLGCLFMRKRRVAVTDLGHEPEPNGVKRSGLYFS
jgi:hypothetical protein